MTDVPPLRPLHARETLSSVKLAFFERFESDFLQESLALGKEHCLKAKADGTMMDGHHRVEVLRGRGVNVDELPREVLE